MCCSFDKFKNHGCVGEIELRTHNAIVPDKHRPDKAHAPFFANVTQLVECRPSKSEVVGSSPIIRSK